MSLANGSRLADSATRPGATRDALVAALASVEGVTAYPVAPDSATAGAAWPKWITSTYGGAVGSLPRDTYECLLTLPAAYTATTVDEGDRFRDQMVFAVWELGTVEFVEPAQITFNDRQTMPGLRLRLVVR